MRRIACLGWGSLIWSPRTLPVSGGWRPDGPLLPIELARQSRDGRITLVVTPGAPGIPTLWADLDVASLGDACTELAAREGIFATRMAHWVAWWSPGGHSGHQGAGQVGAWAAARSLAGVVWTGLPVGFQGSQDIVPTVEQVLAYLRGLQGDRRDRAEEYIRRAPSQTRTPYRAAIERELGWLPIAQQPAREPGRGGDPRARL